MPAALHVPVQVVKAMKINLGIRTKSVGFAASNVNKQQAVL